MNNIEKFNKSITIRLNMKQKAGEFLKSYFSHFKVEMTANEAILIERQKMSYGKPCWRRYPPGEMPLKGILLLFIGSSSQWDSGR